MTFLLLLSLASAPQDLADRLASAGWPGARVDEAGAVLEVSPESAALGAGQAVLLRFEESPEGNGAVIVSAWPVRDGGLAARALGRGALEEMLRSNRAREGAAAIDEDGDLCVVLRIDAARWRSARLRRVIEDLVARADGLLAAADASTVSETSSYTIELHWEGDADLDLNLYHAWGAGSDSAHFATAGELPPDERDILEGGGDPERILVSGRLAQETYLVVVSLWAKGPSGVERAEARLVVRDAAGAVVERRRVISLPHARYWFAGRIRPGRAGIEWIEPPTP